MSNIPSIQILYDLLHPTTYRKFLQSRYELTVCHQTWLNYCIDHQLFAHERLLNKFRVPRDISWKRWKEKVEEIEDGYNPHFLWG